MYTNNMPHSSKTLNEIAGVHVRGHCVHLKAGSKCHPGLTCSCMAKQTIAY